jgi:hypothetical protein
VRASRNLYGEDGRFVVGNINEWQHSAMYVAFLLSGVVDLVGFYMPPGTLPVGTEQVRSPGTPCLSHCLGASSRTPENGARDAAAA